MRANHFSGHIFCPLSLNNGTNDLLNLYVSSTDFAIQRKFVFNAFVAIFKAYERCWSSVGSALELLKYQPKIVTAMFQGSNLNSIIVGHGGNTM